MYQKIFQEDGSPLIKFAKSNQTALQKNLGENFLVLAAMRYGSLQIRDQLKELTDKGCKEILCIPLFPQYSDTTTGSIIENMKKIIKNYEIEPNIKVLKSFSNQEDYLKALQASFKSEKVSNQHTLLSFHGIPKRYASQGDIYQQECEKTAKYLMNKLNIASSDYDIAYQSRFGPEEWLKPYTFDKIKEYGLRGKPLRVICPSFVADCLETIDEIGNEGKEIYEEAGGTDFQLVPALNESEEWVKALGIFIQKAHLDFTELDKL